MNRQTALWQYVMTPRQETGLEAHRRFRKSPGPNLLRWFRRHFAQ